ncbi:hypothetical protein [Corallococcus sp. M7]
MVGFVQRWLRRSLEPYEVVFALIFVLHWAVISSFFIWWAGHSNGPRFFTDVLPYLVYFIAFPVQSVLEAPSRHRVLAGALVVTAVFSVFVHWRASHSYDVHNWNSFPVNVDRNLSRVWDWKDAQFLRAFP